MPVPNSPVDLLKELIRIPSVTPGDAPLDSAPYYGEERLADYLEHYFRAIGLEPERADTQPGRPAVWARLDAGQPKTLLLEAHLDTVEPSPGQEDPFGAQERDGCIYGRGACDTKGSLAVFMETLRQAIPLRNHLQYNVIVAGVPDEEHALTGSLDLAKRLKGEVDFAICGEPTDRVPITTHKGVLRWRITVHGRAAHSSMPEKGDNAIYRAAPLIRAIEWYAYALSERAPDPDLNHPTAVLVEMRGGQAVNIVPGECVLLVDRRVMPGENIDNAEAEFVGFLEGALNRKHWSLERIVTHCHPLERCGADNPFLQALQKALIRHNLPAQTGALHCGTDAPNFVRYGIPSIVWGPGDLALAHTKEEHIRADALQPAVQILLDMLTGAGVSPA